MTEAIQPLLFEELDRELDHLAASMPPPVRPSTHTGDPVTSHRAEARGRASGRIGRTSRLVLLLVVGHPNRGATELELLAATHFSTDFNQDRHARLCQVRKRLSDLRACGLVDRSTERERPAGEGRDEALWYALPLADRVLAR